MIFLALGVFILLVVLDLPSLRKGKDKKELSVYCILSTITLVYLIVFACGGKIFDPAKQFFEFISDIGLNYENWQGHG